MDEDFIVTVAKKELVVAAAAAPEHWLPLSNLDLLLPSVDVGVFFCYKYNNPADHVNGSAAGTGGFGALKAAMAEALLSYYPLSGEVVRNSAGEPELLCNNRGVHFIEAYADIKLQDLCFYNPDRAIQGKLVPQKNHGGVLAVQVTELKCGGVVVGCTFDHRIADAYSANMFLVSWAELAQFKPLSVRPCFRRSLLNPRRPGSYHPSLNHMYAPAPLPSSSAPPLPAESPLFISRIYYVTAHRLALLQQEAATSMDDSAKRRTKLVSFSAFLWKLLALSETDNTKTCKMGIIVDGRSHLSGGAGVHKSSSVEQEQFSSYFGNVLSLPFGEKRIDELKDKPLSWVAGAVHEYLKRATTKEHFSGLIDWVEAHRPVPFLSKLETRGGRDGPAFVVSSGLRFPESKVDFGWGRPALASYHFPWRGGEAGYVMPMPSPARDGDWLVYMHLLERQMKLIETEAAHVLNPLTAEYLNVTGPEA